MIISLFLYKKYEKIWKNTTKFHSSGMLRVIIFLEQPCIFLLPNKLPHSQLPQFVMMWRRMHIVNQKPILKAMKLLNLIIHGWKPSPITPILSPNHLHTHHFLNLLFCTLYNQLHGLHIIIFLHHDGSRLALLMGGEWVPTPMMMWIVHGIILFCS